MRKRVVVLGGEKEEGKLPGHPRFSSHVSVGRGGAGVPSRATTEAAAAALTPGAQGLRRRRAPTSSP